MSTVSIVDVGKSYGGLKVMEKVSFEIGDGEFLILVGPSGCGKSTLLRMLAGLEEITSGQISIGDRVVNDVLPKNRNIAMVFQNYALYPHKTVAENMGFALKMRGVRRDEIEQAVARVAGILGLETLLDRYPKQLSGGQRQRVAMGRAIVRDPDVFLFDEPLSNLDAKLRVQMRTEIKALHERLSSTIVYVTHDQIEAMTMADRIVVLNGGRIEQIGTPLELFDKPRNLFVATFIGSPSMNLIEGQIEDGEGQPIFRAGGDILIPLASDMPVARGRFVLGIRPEHISLATPVAIGSVRARVIACEPMGSDTQLQLALGEQRILGLFHERITVSSGDKFDIVLSPEALHFFDASTGSRL